MTCVPRSSLYPCAKFFRIFQSNAAFSAFSTPSVPPSMKNACGR